MEGDQEPKFMYPSARRDETVEYEYFGTTIKDPYRWLEDPDSEETKKFVDAQNALSVPYINACRARTSIEAKLTEMWDYPKYSAFYREGERYFHFYNSGIQNQSVLYVQDGLNLPAKVFFDPNQLSDDGTISLTLWKFSKNGETLAYALSEAGSDWVTIRFRDVSTEKDYPEILRRVKLSCLDWTHDHRGVFYCKYPETSKKADGTETDSSEEQKLYYHRLGTDESEDLCVVEFPEEPQWRIQAIVSFCGRFVFIKVQKGCSDNLVFFADLEKQYKDGISGKLDLVPIVTKFENDYYFVTNTGSKALFRTNKSAPNFRLVEIDLDDPTEDKWKTVIPNRESDVLDDACVAAGDKLILMYMRDVRSVVEIRDLFTGAELQELPLGVGTVTSVFARRSCDEIFIKFESFLSPGTIFHVDFTKRNEEKGNYECEVFKTTEVKGFDPGEFETKQVFYSSKDGTRVPMFIVHPKDVTLDGTAPALMYGYGGFDVSMQPWFSSSFMGFVKLFHGVLAVPNARGGGEYGERWHNGGRLLNKQNTFDDFHAAAEFLISEKYTSSALLTFMGHSNGGFSVAACLNQRPDLFGVGIVGVGVLDLLRYHKFTIGHAWISDFGDPETNEDDFKNLLKLSPLHNVPDAKSDPKYPATLVLTADHDDRVVPLHSFKFAAELQWKLGRNEKPLMMRIDTKAGHGGGKPTKKRIEEMADTYAFVMRALNLKFCGDEL